MSMVVQKFGGTSVATNERIGRVADRVLETRRAGHDVVVVVSAMGDTTSSLLDRAGSLVAQPPVRELDALLSTGERVSAALLSMVLNERGAAACSLDGRQAGVNTDAHHFNADVESVDPARIRAELAAGVIPVVTGYQGCSAGDDVTTLGLGGSDTTAVALAAALGAERCDICTDVDGVYSADPRIVPDAYRLDDISYTEMMELARHGAGVLNPRSVAHARRHGVRLRVCSTFEPDRPGTRIRDLPVDRIGPRAMGLASHDALTPIVVDAGPDANAEVGDGVRELLGNAGIVMDRTGDEPARRHILVDTGTITGRESLAERMAEYFGDVVSVGRDRGSVSAVGFGVGSDRRLAEAPRRDAERAGIPLYGYFRSDHALSCVLSANDVGRAMQLLHDRLETTPVAA